MKRIVLVDGENLLYGLRSLLGPKGGLGSRESFEKYNFRGLVETILEEGKPKEILWFGARLRLYEATDKLKEKTTQAIAMQAKLVNLLRAQKITFVKAGYLRARESSNCPNCGHQEWKLIEKGVDVGLAVRILQEVSKDTEIILMSADTDLLPAMRAAKKSGARIMYVGYENRPINALSQQANTTRIITKPMAKKFMVKIK